MKKQDSFEIEKKYRRLSKIMKFMNGQIGIKE
jgi:hypothetical protein